MSGSFVRCLVATAVLVSASSVHAAPEAPPLNQPLSQSASQPAIKAESQPPVPADPAPAPAKAAEVPASAPVQPVPFTLERAALPASDAKPLPPAIAEKPALAVQAPAPIAVPAKASEAPLTPTAPAATAAASPPAPQANSVTTPAPVQAVAPFNAGISDEERAKQILANEQRGSKPKLHALQTESPDYNIVICEAGCGDSRAHVIYKQPVSAIRSALADPAAANAALTKKAECRGGCDGNHSQKQASLGGAAPALLNDTAGSWMTTVEPSAPKAPAASAKPQASKSLKEDWMARINRQRAVSKEQPETASPSEVEVKEPEVTEPSLIRER